MLSLPAMDDLLSVAEEDDSGCLSATSRKHPSAMVVDTVDGPASAISSPVSPFNPSRSSLPNINSGSSSSSNSNGARICGASSSSVYSTSSQTNTLPPAFNDLVKRSTRFITAVPAYEVLEKVETILESVRIQRTSTPIGLIGKVELNWDRYRLEVWGMDTQGAALCALQLYQMPSSAAGSSASVQSSPDRNFGSRLGQVAYSPATASLYESPFVVGSLGGTMPSSSPSFATLHQSLQQPQQLYLVEFIRGQLEIFAFKRFYQWVRHRLSELVKRDYSIRLFEQASSPM